MFRPIRILILTGLLVAAVMPSVAHGKAQIGISDNKPNMFTDPAFKDLKTKYSRVVVSWNVLAPKTAAGKDEKVRLAQWMAGAKANGQSVLVAIDASRDAKASSTYRKLAFPKKKNQLGKEIKKLKKAYPQIKAISPWNEANLNKKPKQVAQWAKEAKKNCKGCKVVIDTLDKPNLNSWTKSYIKASKKAGVKTKIWGLHNYVDVNNFQSKRTKAFLKVTKKTPIWLTETGGVVNRANPGSRFAGTGIDHQTKATTFLIDQIVKKNARIKYVFFYNWSNEVAFSSGYLSWDSALRDADGTLRPAYQLLKAYK